MFVPFWPVVALLKKKQLISFLPSPSRQSYVNGLATMGSHRRWSIIDFIPNAKAMMGNMVENAQSDQTCRFFGRDYT